MAVTSPTGNIFADSAVLAANAYSDTPDADVALGWQPLGAADLGIAETGSFGGGTYTLRNGVYVDTDGTNGAVAHVYVGELNGTTTLALAFRGTDEAGDLTDHLHFTDHFAQFQPLMTAIQNYVNDPSHGIEQVVVTGHSLGSAMVTTAMIEQGWLNDPKYLGVAIASHGTDASLAATAPAEVTNLVNFIHTQDFLVLAKENGLPASTIGDLLDARPLVGSEADFEPKARIGTDVWIDTGNAVHLVQAAAGGTTEDPITAEHRIGRYQADITTLAEHDAIQPAALLSSNAPHYFAVGTDQADDFRQDQLFDSASLNSAIFPTKDFDQQIFTEAGDDRIGGSGGNDLIDGGPGNDTAYYRGAAAAYTITTAADGTTTVAHTSPGTGPSDGTDTLTNVETLHFADGDRTPGGTPIAQGAAPAEPEHAEITFDNLIQQPGVTLSAVGDEISNAAHDFFG